jgi:hypothetical protein
VNESVVACQPVQKTYAKEAIELQHGPDPNGFVEDASVPVHAAGLEWILSRPPRRAKQLELNCQ